MRTTVSEKFHTTTSFSVAITNLKEQLSTPAVATADSLTASHGLGKRSSAKRPQNPKIARTAPKNFLNNSRGLPGHYPVKQGFEANRTRKLTVAFGQIFVTQFLCGAFSVPKKDRQSRSTERAPTKKPTGQRRGFSYRRFTASLTGTRAGRSRNEYLQKPLYKR